MFGDSITQNISSGEDSIGYPKWWLIYTHPMQLKLKVLILRVWTESITWRKHTTRIKKITSYEYDNITALSASMQHLHVTQPSMNSICSYIIRDPHVNHLAQKGWSPAQAGATLNVVVSKFFLFLILWTMSWVVLPMLSRGSMLGSIWGLHGYCAHVPLPPWRVQPNINQTSFRLHND